MDKRRAFLQIGCMPLEDLARPHRKRQSMMIGVFGTSPEFHQADEVDEKFLRSLDREGGNEEGYPVGFTEGVQNSKALDRLHEFHIVIAASGMCEAGRIRHRLKTLLWRDEATVFTVGFVDLARARAEAGRCFRSEASARYPINRTAAAGARASREARAQRRVETDA